MEVSLDNLHKCELIICNEIKRVCEKNGIKYFLYFGSLLGAIRHKGFIPWDDDMDVAMTRENYTRFIKCFREDSDQSRFYIEEHTTNADYPLQFAKIKLNNTEFLENSIRETTLHKGIFVDIFPLDFCSGNKEQRCKEKARFQFFVKMLKFKKGYLPTDPHNTKQLIMSRFTKYVTLLVPQKVIQYLVEKHSWNSNMRTKYVGAISSAYKDDAVLFDWVNDTVDVPFEGEYYAVPVDYEKVLVQIYGNYMKLPAEKDRWPRHFPEHIDYGQYLEVTKND